MNAQSPELEEIQRSHGPYSYFNHEDDANVVVQLNDPSSSYLTVFDRQGINQLSTNPDRDSQNESEAFDYERTLQDIVTEMDKSNVKRRELGVMFRNLRVVGLSATSSFQPTIGSIFNPKIIWENIQNARHPRVKDILSGFEGVVRPGEMLLVLGIPGSGCTTFLKTLVNKRKEFHSVEGEVHYDSFSPEEIAKNYRGDLQYCPEDDVHFPTLTVEETIRFAVKSRAPHARIAGQTRDDYINTMTNVLVTVFGLKNVRNTVVGDASIRGVSGGEKKRVSIAEAMALRSVINSWDNSTRGLDSSTALEFVRALRVATNISRTSTIVSLYQAGESLYEVFDKVCLIYQGKMAYYGPANLARQYFIDMGYEPANRQTTADFLVSVTDHNARTVRSGFMNRVPRTPSEFFSYYRNSQIAQLNEDDIESYRREFVDAPERAAAYTESARAEHATTVNKNSSYLISIPMQIKAVMLRRLFILKGSRAAQIATVSAFMIQAVLFGTFWLRLGSTTTEFYSRGGALFYMIFFPALMAQAEIPALFQQRSVVARHEKVAMYHPFIEAAALTLVDIPATLIILICYSVICYFATGLQKSAGQFFVFLLFVFSVSITMKAFFRGSAAMFRTIAPAQTIAGLVLLTCILYDGFVIPKLSMIGAIDWITWLSPHRYAFEAIMGNEFSTLVGTCSSLVPSGLGYENVSIKNQVCTTMGSLPGQVQVNGNAFLMASYGYSHGNLWRNFGIVIGMAFAFTLILLVFTEINCDISEQRVIMLFKRGRNALVGTHASDEEKAGRLQSDSATILNQDIYRPTNAEGFKPLKTMDTFSWEHLMYTVNVSGNPRRLLNDVSGYVAPGKLTALMGESGAGKTTLLNVLAQRTDIGVVSGDMFVNGQKLPSDFQAQTGYCQQTDTHVHQDTVREAILFSALLRQPRSVSIKEKEAYVDTCIVTCGLERYADAVVGTLGVEHRKRLTIAVELVAKPKLLLFLDEPTSGLDSQSAWAIISFLKYLAESGQAILCTIHQPSAELFQMFDRLLLLRKGGETVYFGDLGERSTTMINYFERYGARKCHHTENPAEYMLEVIGAGATATSEIDWHNGVWRQTPECKAVQSEIDCIHVDGRARPYVAMEKLPEYSAPWIQQVAKLLARDLRVHWRDPSYLAAKLALNVVSGLYIGFTFWKAKDSIQGSQNKLMALYSVLVLSFPLAMQVLIPFLDMRTIYEVREKRSRMYSWTALLTSQVLAEYPFNAVASTLNFFCWYWTVGFSSSRAGYVYLVFGVIFPMYYATLIQAIAAMSPDANVAGIFFGIMMSFVLLYNGILQPFRLLHWWKWMYWVVPYTYMTEGLVGQAIGNQPITCATSEFVHLNPPSGLTCAEYLGSFMTLSGGYITNPNATTSCQYCAFSTTDQWMGTTYNMFYSHRWRDLGAYVGYVFFNIFALFMLTYLLRIRRWRKN